MQKIIIGIDPGKTGAIAVRYPGTGDVVVHKMPPTSMAVKELLEAIAQTDNIEKAVVIEKVGNFHPTGDFKADMSRITGALKQREQMGELRMACLCLGLAVKKEVMPSVWMERIAPGRPKGKTLGTAAARKAYIWDVVQKRYPNTKIHKYAADAVGIMDYGWMMGYGA